jgi:hypothetical protein
MSHRYTGLAYNRLSFLVSVHAYLCTFSLVARRALPPFIQVPLHSYLHFTVFHGHLPSFLVALDQTSQRTQNEETSGIYILMRTDEKFNEAEVGTQMFAAPLYWVRDARLTFFFFRIVFSFRTLECCVELAIFRSPSSRSFREFLLTFISR